MTDLDLQEQITRIDHMLADIHKNQAQASRLQQEIQYAPWIIGVSLMTAGAAFFAAGVAFVKLLG